MEKSISTRAGSQSDDPDLRQAVAALPGAILASFWYNLLATKLPREVRKLNNQKLIDSIKDLTAALLVNSLFYATVSKDELQDKPEENLETVRTVLKMWQKMRERV